VVSHLRRQPALLADRDDVANAVQHPSRFIPNVRLMDATELAGDVRKVDHFLERRIEGWDVEEAGAEAKSAAMFVQHVLHAVNGQARAVRARKEDRGDPPLASRSQAFTTARVDWASGVQRSLRPLPTTLTCAPDREVPAPWLIT
jgi:hypothetical protein